MPLRSSDESGNACVPASCVSMALRFRSYSASLGSAAETASKICFAVAVGPRLSGALREKRRDTKSARLLDSSKSALYINCS